MTGTPGPRSGDDTHDLIDHALYQLAERRGKWLGDPLTSITLLASLIDQAGRMLPEHVLEARDNGSTWHDIAAALATSPEQAELRPPSPAQHRESVACYLKRPPRVRGTPQLRGIERQQNAGFTQAIGVVSASIRYGRRRLVDSRRDRLHLPAPSRRRHPHRAGHRRRDQRSSGPPMVS